MEDKKEKLPSTRIQWLITIYPRIRESLGKIRDCDI